MPEPGEERAERDRELGALLDEREVIAVDLDELGTKASKRSALCDPKAVETNGATTTAPSSASIAS